MAEINILIAFDTGTIGATPKPSQDPNNPTAIGAGSIFMIASQQNVITGNGGNELNVSANTGDIIRWREMSLSLDVDDRVMLYQFHGSNNNLITAPQPIVITIKDPIPGVPPAPPLPPASQTIQDFFWQTTVLQQGTDTYQFSFVLNRRNGNLIGYFIWDPFITISN
jgi:hypothetical protein